MPPPDCITTFWHKTSVKPPTGRRPIKPGAIQLTPIQKNFTTVMIWALVSQQGTRLQGSGVRTVSRVSAGVYSIRFELSREDDNFIISRWSDDHQNDSQEGPYSRITEQSDRTFMIEWVDRDGSPLDTNFSFGVYG